jgi:hypothetical protein
MADTKISALTDGVTLEATDRLIVARSPFASGDNRYVTGAAVAATASGREQLTAARTYYVRTDGDDGNTGLVNNAGGAFETIQRACNAISTDIDQNGYAITVSIGAGTHAGFQITGSMPSGTRTNGVLEFTAGAGLDNSDVHISDVCYITDVYIRFTNLDFQSSLWCECFTQVYTVDCQFSSNAYIYIRPFVNIHINGDTTIATSGTFQFLFFDGGPSQVIWDGDITLTGTPGWSQAFMRLDGSGADTGGGNTVQWAVDTVTGSGTGQKFSVGYNQYLLAFPPGDLADIPGNAAGVRGVLKSFATTVGALPSASTSGAGSRFFVTDANSTTFLATAVGGGANAVPVVSNGTNWVIG